MRQKIFSVLIFSALLLFALSGCGDSIKQAALNAAESVVELLSGETTGEVGKTYSTQWFEFTVESIEEVSEYEGYLPAEGYTLYDVRITEKGTFEEASPMGTFDFYMDASSFPEYVYPIDPLNDEMMPLNFDLEPNQTVEYHMVYEVPMDVSGLNLIYTEVDEDDNEGVTFNIPIE
ncbi:MAG: DUF4352 domain-containing protein [Clostridiales Family XIII bacterium]|jgi:hypothetical protein|nr:DUF4352 domain-containing protein [Clostridiales Family XIII bacterium]